MISQGIQEKITGKAVSLEKYCVWNLAWIQEDAKELTKLLMHDKIGIFGGDVYKLDAKHLQPLYDNWHCEPKSTESYDEFFLRSKVEALKYIENYSVPSLERGELIVFSITFTEQIVVKNCDERRLKLMNRELLSFENNLINLDSLIGILIFLLDSLDTSKPVWKNDFLSSIQILESIHDSIKNSLVSEWQEKFKKDLQNAILSLKKLISDFRETFLDDSLHRYQKLLSNPILIG